MEKQLLVRLEVLQESNTESLRARAPLRQGPRVRPPPGVEDGEALRDPLRVASRLRCFLLPPPPPPPPPPRRLHKEQQRSEGPGLPLKAAAGNLRCP